MGIRIFLNLLFLVSLINGLLINTSALCYAQDIPVLKVKPDRSEQVEIDKLISEVSYTVLDLPDQEFLREVQKVIMNDSGIYLYDVSNNGERPKIFSFEPDGRFRFVLDKPGRGPGEFERIYDFDVLNDFIVLSTQTEIKFYDTLSGEYSHAFDKPRTEFIQTFGLINKSLLVYNGGRTRNNTDKHLIKVYDLEKSDNMYQGLPFEDHALKGGHSYRYIFNYQDTISLRPDYTRTVYRLIESGADLDLVPAYSFDFDGYWVDEDLLLNSYDNRGRFFSEINDYIHTFDVFETAGIIYVTYRLDGEDYTYIYDKRSEFSINISAFETSRGGWLNTPETTFENRIINVVRDFEFAELDINWSERLTEILSGKEENDPILIKADFRVQ